MPWVGQIRGMTTDRYDHNDDHSDITTLTRAHRVQVLVGPERRRKWPMDVKIAIIAEALNCGDAVSDVALRHDITPSQLFGWIRRFRKEIASRPSPTEPPLFAPAVIDTSASSSVPPVTTAEPPSAIEIVIGAATVRLGSGVDARALGIVLTALRPLA